MKTGLKQQKKRFLVCDLQSLESVNGCQRTAEGVWEGVPILSAMGVGLYAVDLTRNTCEMSDAMNRLRIRQAFSLILGAECTIEEALAEFARSKGITAEAFCRQAIFVSCVPGVLRSLPTRHVFPVGVSDRSDVRPDFFEAGAHDVIERFDALTDFFV